jgi:hypothetical protein
MTYIEENWAFNNDSNISQKPFPEIKPGDGFISCNFSRTTPMTKLFEGIDNLMFEGCNMNNCDIWANETWIINLDTCSFCQNEYDFTPEIPNIPSQT